MAIAFMTNDKGISTESRFFTHDGQLRDHIDFDEARSILNFNVITEEVYRPNGVIVAGEGDNAHTYVAKGEKVEGVYNLVRTDTNELLPLGKTVGREFTPVNHYEMFDFLRDKILPQMNELKLETVATMYGGAASLIEANFGDAFHLPNDESDHRTRIVFSNPMGKGSLVMGFTNIRVVCQNTLSAARKQVSKASDGFKIQHCTNANYIVQKALNSIYAQIESAKELRSLQTVLANKEVTAEQVQNVLDAVYPISNIEKGTKGFTRTENTRNEVIRQFESGETAQTMTKKTAWSLFNSFTYPIFNATKLHSHTDRAEIAYSGLVGTRADKVNNIFNKVYNEVIGQSVAVA